MHRIESGLLIVKRHGIRIEKIADGFMASSARQGSLWLEFVHRLAQNELHPQLVRRGVVFDPVTIEILDALLPKLPRSRSWLFALAALAFVSVMGISLTTPDAPTKSTPDSACENSVAAATAFVAKGSGAFKQVRTVDLGGVQTATLTSTCSEIRYEITLAGKPTRVISVKLR